MCGKGYINIDLCSKISSAVNSLDCIIANMKPAITAMAELLNMTLFIRNGQLPFDWPVMQFIKVVLYNGRTIFNKTRYWV